MKKLLIVILLSLITFLSHSQEDKLQAAFSRSYTEESAGSYAKAISTLKEVYTESSYELNLRLGWLCYNNLLHVEAIQYYGKAILLKPYSVEARLGFVYPASVLGNWDQVLDQYLEILKIDAGNATVNYRAGLIYYNRKNYDLALRYFAKLVNMYPFGFDGVYMLAWTFLKTGKTKEAHLMFNKALLISPGNEAALEGLRLAK